MAKLASKTYGEALFELALEEKRVDEVLEEITVIQTIFAENLELLRLLNHPKISKEEKISIIETIFKERVSDSVVGFLTIIVEKGRYNDMNDMFEYFIGKVREYKNIGVAFVTSAIELTEIQKQQIEARLLQTTNFVKFEMNYNIDQTLIGGMVIRIGDRVVDSSIKAKLSVLAKDLSNIQLA